MVKTKVMYYELSGEKIPTPGIYVLHNKQLKKTKDGWDPKILSGNITLLVEESFKSLQILKQLSNIKHSFRIVFDCGLWAGNCIVKKYDPPCLILQISSELGKYFPSTK